ncbi:hypothetical protein DRO61_12055 [Candidatus Bathyarchaeota archaeon]|nr:MAG: hypothetical protein DRO61_12055 [Candidatus Bathyarchaeota archaeon]
MRAEQSIFLHNVAKLILWAFEQGYELTGGELHRTEDQQQLYYYGFSIEETNGNLYLLQGEKKTKTLNSKHKNKLAVDLNLFINGKYITEGEKFAPLAAYWSKLDRRNESGSDWNYDHNHFQMTL